MDLSGGEYELLLAFLRRPRIVLTRDQLLDITRRRGAGPFDRAIDVQVGRLRRKIEADPKRPRSLRPCAAAAMCWLPRWSGSERPNACGLDFSTFGHPRSIGNPVARMENHPVAGREA